MALQCHSRQDCNFSPAGCLSQRQDVGDHDRGVQLHAAETACKVVSALNSNMSMSMLAHIAQGQHRICIHAQASVGQRLPHMYANETRAMPDTGHAHAAAFRTRYLTVPSSIILISLGQ